MSLVDDVVALVTVWSDASRVGFGCVSEIASSSAQFIVRTARHLPVLGLTATPATAGGAPPPNSMSKSAHSQASIYRLLMDANRDENLASGVVGSVPGGKGEVIGVETSDEGVTEEFADEEGCDELGCDDEMGSDGAFDEDAVPLLDRRPKGDRGVRLLTGVVGVPSLLRLRSMLSRLLSLLLRLLS